jgi:UDP-galactopyranose mutase
MSKKYDFIIVGSGLYGSTLAYLLSMVGKKVAVLEKADHTGGKLHSYKDPVLNIPVDFGPHIFHTKNKDVYEFVNSLVELKPIHYSIAAYNGKKYFHIPFDMNTFNDLWNISEIAPAIAKLKEQILPITTISNSEDYYQSFYGKDLYNKIIKNYICKIYGDKNTFKNIVPGSIVSMINSTDMIPIYSKRYTTMFNTDYSGIIANGTGTLIDSLLENCDVIVNSDYLANKQLFDSWADYVIYTGRIDEYYDYKYGELKWCSIDFSKPQYKLIEESQGCPVKIDITKNSLWYRTTEPAYFYNKESDADFNSTLYINESYHIVDNEHMPCYPYRSQSEYDKWKKYWNQPIDSQMIFGGSLAEFKFYTMDETILNAIQKFKIIMERCSNHSNETDNNIIKEEKSVKETRGGRRSKK